MNAALLAMLALEMQRLFRRPLAWLVLALATALMAMFFLALMVRYLEDEGGVLRNAGVTAEILVRYFGSAALLTLLFTPLLTMQVVSSDKRDGLLRFLFSTPVTSAAIVGGKLGAVLVLMLLLWFTIGLIPVTLAWGAPIDLGVYATNLLGLALFMLLHATLGVMASALTVQPLAAALAALLLSVTLWLADWGQRLDPDSTLLGGISTLSRLRSFAVGLISVADVAYFSLGALMCAAITVWAVEHERRFT